MEIQTVTLTDKVLGPDGDPVIEGTIEVTLSQPASILDGAGGVPYLIAPLVIHIGSDGSIPAGTKLAPNSALTPSGTHYRATYKRCRTHDGVTAQIPDEKWQIEAAPDPLPFGSIPRRDVIPGIAIQTQQAVADAVAALAYNIDGGTPESVWGGAPGPIDGGAP